MTRKIVYLFLALLLPGLIFIFLKRFGKNEFDIPVFYQNSADSLNRVCGTRYRSPYTIADSILHTVGWNRKKATIFLFSSTTGGKELNRLSDTFAATDFDLILVRRDAAAFQHLESCVFFMRPNRDLVLVDDRKRIRGYYLSSHRDEMDRLIVELKILLKQY